MVGETNAGIAGGTPRSDPEFWDDNDDMTNQSHSGFTNYLFCDGHVKTMKPTATGTPINMWNVTNTAKVGDANPGAAGADSSTASLAAWLANAQTKLK